MSACRYCGKRLSLSGRVTCGHPICRKRMNRGEAPPTETLKDAVSRMQEHGATAAEIVDRIAQTLGISRAEALHIARKDAA